MTRRRRRLNVGGQWLELVVQQVVHQRRRLPLAPAGQVTNMHVTSACNVARDQCVRQKTTFVWADKKDYLR